MPPFKTVTSLEVQAQTRHVVSFTLRGISDKGLVDLMWGSVRGGIERRTRAIVRAMWDATQNEFRYVLRDRPIESWFGKSWDDYMLEANRRGLWPAMFLGVDLMDLANYIALSTLCSPSNRKETKRLVSIGAAAATATSPTGPQYAPKNARPGRKGSFRSVPTRR